MSISISISNFIIHIIVREGSIFIQKSNLSILNNLPLFSLGGIKNVENLNFQTFYLPIFSLYMVIRVVQVLSFLRNFLTFHSNLFKYI